MACLNSRRSNDRIHNFSRLLQILAFIVFNHTRFAIFQCRHLKRAKRDMKIPLCPFETEIKSKNMTSESVIKIDDCMG